MKETTVPQRIDTSVLKAYSGAIQRVLVLTLKSLNLIDRDRIVTEKLRELVKEYKSDNWKNILKGIIDERYNDIVGSLNIADATRYQLEERFRNAGADREVMIKCIAFYVSAVKEADIPISPYITIERRGRPPETGKKKTQKAQDGGSQEKENNIPPSKPGMAQFRYHIKGKTPATISIPEDITAEEWEMIKKGIDAYVLPGEKKE